MENDSLGNDAATPPNLDWDAPAPAPPAPLLWPAVAFAGGVAAGELLGGERAGWTAMALPFVLAAGLFMRRERAARAALILLALAVGYARHQNAVSLRPNHITHLLSDEPELTRLAGRVVSTPVSRPSEKRNPFLPFKPPPRTRFLFRVAELRTQAAPEPVTGVINVTVEADALTLRMGDAVVLTGRIYRPSGPRNPGATDWAAVQRRQGIHAAMLVPGGAFVQPAARPAPPPLWLRIPARVRDWASATLHEPLALPQFDERRNLLDAMVLGQRSAAGRALNEAFVRTGAMHFLAVSGFHVGLLGWLVWVLSRHLLRRDAATAAWITLFALCWFVCVAEPNAPILRAAIMGVLICLAQIRGRPVCTLNWLALSSLCILAWNPLELFRAGFQLSFVCVLAIVLLTPRVWRVLRSRWSSIESPGEYLKIHQIAFQKLGKWILGAAVVSVCAWLVSLPLIMHHFGRFAPLGALQSMLLLPVVVGVVVLGLLTVLTPWLGPLGVVTSEPLRWTSGALLWLVDRLGGFSYSMIEIEPPPAWLVVLTYAGAAYCFTRLKSEPAPVTIARRLVVARSVPVVACLVAGAWIWCFVSPTWSRPQAFELHVLAVGDGSAAILKTPDGRASVFDVGTRHNFDVGGTAGRALRALRIRRLEAVYISHANFDHYSGLPTLHAAGWAERIYVNPYLQDERLASKAVRRLFSMIGDRGVDFVRIQAGETVAVSGASTASGTPAASGAKVDVLWPPHGLADWAPNDRSLVLRLTIHGRRILIPGDIEADAMWALLEASRAGRIDLAADVLIAPHHGSIERRASAEFYQAVGPRYVVVSASRARPALREMLRTLAPLEIELISTHDAGAVCVHVDSSGELSVRTPFR